MFSKKKRQILLGLALSLAVLAAPVANADAIYVDFDRVIEGDSTRENLEKTVQASSWSWAMNQTATDLSTGRVSVGRPQIQALVFSHRIDRASPKLMEHLVTGKEIPRARLLVFQSGTEARAPYLIIELEKVMISSIKTGSGNSEGGAVESVGLTFSKFAFKYTETDAKGTRTGELRFQWDLMANRPY